VPREVLPDAVTRAWNFIRQRIEERPNVAIDLKHLARVACVTPEHLCRLFKATLGHSPVETVRLARLDRAAVFLARSNYAVGEIAEMCGFASQFHFSRRFKQAYGKSPRQLRTDIQNGAAPPLPRLIQYSALIGNPGPGLKYAGSIGLNAGKPR
jgi:AraC family transcriptional regulator